MTRRAITPIEVLLCLSVVVSTAAALAPLRTQDAGADKRKSCLSNVKQVATAIAIYEADYDDIAPRAKKWMDSILPYTRNEKILHCTEVAPSAYGYAYSSLVAGKSVVKVASPAEEPLVFDSTHLERSATATIKSLPSPARHSGKNNVAYVDTHAKSIGK